MRGSAALLKSTLRAICRHVSVILTLMKQHHTKNVVADQTHMYLSIKVANVFYS